MPVAGVQEQLRAIDRLDELACRRKVLECPLVALHHVNLERDARRPRVAELGERKGRVEQQRPLRAAAVLGEPLGRGGAEREASVDEAPGQGVGRGYATTRDRRESHLAGVADAVLERVERLALIEIRSMDGMPGGAKLVREGQEAGRLSLRVVKEQYLRHGGQPTRRDCVEWMPASAGPTA